MEKPELDDGVARAWKWDAKPVAMSPVPERVFLR